ncbi:uncharacterized protein KY384_003112 [Bacidia gigantensis]|uniref:uncharacterized protein n=1 Tax=Bacidia gigantensis TaxID=2732470 RepID=UPI001D050D9D|nr:uncharacterized protein KY384_003112 [Bacidia gigantensis]KAG8531483.1 hypothetical protein KY384_003112 [Bacidia gigantensis]
MEVARALIRTVARAFYDTKHVLVIDALMIHSASAAPRICCATKITKTKARLPVDDLAYLLNMQSKDLRKLCGKLREDRLLAVQARPEIRDGMSRPVSREYYFIDFHATIDAIKYRVYMLDAKVKELYKPIEEKKDYFCPTCKAQWTQLEVIDKYGPMGFECHRCGGLLEREEKKEGEETGHEMEARLHEQTKRIVGMLKQIDSQEIPNNDFETALSLARAVDRDHGSNQLKPYQPEKEGKASAAAKGLRTGIVALDVSVTEHTAAEKADEAQRKASAAAQNVLPVWHTTSTVANKSVLPTAENGGGQPNGTPVVKEDEEEKKDSGVLNDELTAYYAQLAREKEKEAQEDREADESSGNNEDEFEDVDVGLSNVGTPLSSPSADAEEQRSLNMKKETESGSSGPATNSSTPVNGEGPAFKKVKFEESASGRVNGELGAGGAADKVSDEDDDEVEFEDV